ncbi:MAG: hypothetical protein IJ419_12745 [Agathobacter sp.]|nr:hypothetical protein [Agathobacter sp.]
MKCPSCGAETTGKFCEYCGSEMPQVKAVGTCPKCGGNNVSFKRERIGTATQSRSYKNVFGNGRTGQSVSQSAYRTVGLCQSCGYTWNPNSSSKSSGKKTWLWVLGWICIFPVPLTILMLRKKDMKPAVKYGIIAAAWLLFFAIGASGGETETTPTDVPTTTEAVVEQVTETTEAVPEVTEATEALEVYYDRDETINLYLNRFNAVNPDAVIDSELFEVYYHHGSEHDDQIIFTRDDFEVVISGNYLNNSISLVIDGSGDKTADDYKLIFMQYARAYNPNLTDEKLEEYWQAVLDDIINSAEFDEFDCALQVYNDKIEYMTMDGKIQ